MKTVVIIQARMGSTRLSGKVMKILIDKTVLAHDIERVNQSQLIDDIIIATTNSETDDIIVKEAERCGVKVFRGSENNVLSRYYYAAKENKADIVIRITSDCPLIDPVIIDKVIDFYKNNKYDIVTNAGIDISKRTFPRGLDVEIFSFDKLEEAFINAIEPYQLEHVTPYIYEHGVIGNYINNVDYSKYRWTLDTDEDWTLINEIYRHLYHGKHNFYFEHVLRLMEKYPELSQINEHVEQKKVK